MIKICIAGKLVRCEFIWLQQLDQLSKSQEKCQKCRPISNLNMKNENLAVVHPMGLLYFLGWHNSSEVLITQWIRKEKYRYSKCGQIHNLQMTTKTLQGVPPLSSIFPLGRYNSMVTQSVFLFYLWGLALNERF